MTLTCSPNIWEVVTAGSGDPVKGPELKGQPELFKTKTPKKKRKVFVLSYRGKQLYLTSRKRCPNLTITHWVLSILIT